MIFGENVENVAFTGTGTIDGDDKLTTGDPGSPTDLYALAVSLARQGDSTVAGVHFGAIDTIFLADT